MKRDRREYDRQRVSTRRAQNDTRKKQRLELLREYPETLKSCHKCHEAKLLSQFSPQGHKCRVCVKEYDISRISIRKSRDEIRKQKQRLDSLNVVKRCNMCDEEKFLSDFYLLRQRCISCDKKRAVDYAQTLDGYLHNMLRNMKTAANVRRRNGRPEAGICSLTFEDVKKIYESQNGYCYYYKIKKMNHIPNSEWRISAERLNPKKGYIEGNVVLCCFEFNTARQWSLELLNEIITLRETKVDQKEFENSLEPPRQIENNGLNNLVLEDGRRVCRRCNSVILIKGRKGYYTCKSCEALRIHEYQNSPRSFIIGLTNRCRTNSKTRIIRAGVMKGECTITAQKIINQIIKQGNLCYYSGIPLTFRQFSQWSASIERLDVKKGYIDGNWVVICGCFNATTNQGSEEVGVGAQWSQGKFNEFLHYLRERNNS